MVDRDAAKKLLGVLQDNLADLRRYRAGLTREQLHRDRDVQHQVLHAFYLASQAALDLALHWGADAGLRQAGTYQDAFRRLAEGGLVGGELAERLAGWASFRNILAHTYAVVDFDRAFDALHEIGDLEALAAAVAQALA